VIGNAIDLDRIQRLPAPRNERPQIAFLGSPGQTWHGVDKILWLANAMPEARFELIGYDRRDLGDDVAANVRVRGMLSRQDYEPILATSDVAIGTLALHRKQMDEACPLKVREYLAYGLPVIAGYEDTDFIGEQPWFMLRLPNRETNVRDSVGRVREFAERVRGRRVPRELVVERISVQAKEPRRLEFFERVAGAQRAASTSV
jgi:glycosyltransferase involved in cell wall biosynthesis